MTGVPQFSGVLFDMDGTLIDSESLHEAVDRAVFDACGIEVAEADWLTFKGRPSLDVFEDVRQRYGGTLTADEMVLRKQALFLECTSQIEVLPGAHALLHQLRQQRVSVALVTSTEQALVTPILAGLDLSFDAVITADDVARTKPDPDPYLRGAAALRLPPSACVAVEDALSGVQSARGARCYVIAVPTSFDARALREAGAHHVAADLAEVQALLRA